MTATVEEVMARWATHKQSPSVVSKFIAGFILPLSDSNNTQALPLNVQQICQAHLVHLYSTSPQVFSISKPNAWLNSFVVEISTLRSVSTFTFSYKCEHGRVSQT